MLHAEIRRSAIMAIKATHTSATTNVVLLSKFNFDALRNSFIMALLIRFGFI